LRVTSRGLGDVYKRQQLRPAGFPVGLKKVNLRLA
jgi:hypothetical protein